MVTKQLSDFKEHRLLDRQLKSMETSVKQFEKNSRAMNQARQMILRNWRAYKLEKEINKRVLISKTAREREQRELAAAKNQRKGKRRKSKLANKATFNFSNRSKKGIINIGMDRW